MKKYLILTLSLFLLFNSCKKRKKETMVIDITAVNPVTQEPFKGVKFYITEVTTKKKLIGNAYEYEQIYTGETDGSGHVYYEFEIPQDYKWTYEINFDFTQMDAPEADYYLNKGLHFDYLQRDEVNSFNFELMPYGDYVLVINNVNCTGSDDKMRWRNKNIYTGNGEWSLWHTPYNQDYLTGCFNDSYLKNEPSDRIITQIEVIKNNITTIITDTFYVNPESIDTLKLYFYFLRFSQKKYFICIIRKTNLVYMA